MAAEEALPCRHRGAPPEEVVNRVAEIIRAIGDDENYLYKRGLSAEEFRLALPTAIEQLRGSRSASNSERRDFLATMLDHLATTRAIASYTRPMYGAETVYRLVVPSVGDVAIIQKGCPDGRHSSEAWSAPDWAIESYLWWLCPSLKGDPGWHVTAGVNRLRRQFFSSRPDMIDGVIFHNQLCGTDLRPCPKKTQTIVVDGVRVPPPCLWIMPERSTGPDYNWDGSRRLRFPQILLSAFGVAPEAAELFTGHIGFQTGPRGARTTITSRYGAGCSTTSRS